jgi:hypothetical protein
LKRRTIIARAPPPSSQAPASYRLEALPLDRVAEPELADWLEDAAVDERSALDAPDGCALWPVVADASLAVPIDAPELASLVPLVPESAPSVSITPPRGGGEQS